MAKLIKGDSVQNIITDGDVIITSPSKIGKTLDEVLVEQQSDIDRLKSNVKYIYAYGGVGGSGSGGGSGSNEKPISSFVLLNGVDIVNTTDDIVLDGKGKYKLYIKIFNAGGRTIFVGYSTTGAVTDNMMRYKLNSDNLYTTEIDIDLNKNGMLNVRIMDDEGSPIGYYSRKYIVESDSFNVTLNYTDATNKEQSYTSEPYECFINDPFKRDRYFKIDYSIYLLGYENVSIKCEIDGIKEPIYQGTQGVDLPMEGENCMIKINGEPILQNKYMGTYTLRATLSYIISGREIVRTRTVKFSVVPSGLYINVRTNGDVLYDTLKQLKDDKINGKDGIPYKHISQGSSLMMYCKVFEDAMESYPNTYVTTVKSYNMYYGDMGEELWDDMGITQNETLYEQIESSKGISITFSTEGIKKIVISTTSAKTPGLTATFEKFVYVKKFDSQCDWYNDTRYGIIAESYFRANQGENTYKLFPILPSGNSVLSLTKSSTPIEINNTDLDNPNESILCTVISFGIQVSNINSENVKIVDIYTQGSLEKSTYALRLNTLFADDGTNKISIPTEVLMKMIIHNII
jgi:hypothetical protein